MLIQNLQAEFAEMLLTNETKTSLVKPAELLSIYHNNFFTTLIQSLKDTYPLIMKLLGEDFFQMTAKVYITQYPSTSGDLHEYGAYFSDFLKEYASVNHLPYLSEVAQFEWACHLIFFASDHLGFDLNQLSIVSEENYSDLHFSLHPASAVMRFYYPILEIVDLCEGKNAGPLDIDSGGIYLLLKRFQNTIQFLSLSEADFIFLSAIHADFSLNNALNQALSVDVTFNLEKKLPYWVQNKIIVEAHLTHAYI